MPKESENANHRIDNPYVSFIPENISYSRFNPIQGNSRLNGKEGRVLGEKFPPINNGSAEEKADILGGIVGAMQVYTMRLSVLRPYGCVRASGETEQ